MKVVCKDNHQGTNHLTVGKEYAVVDDSGNYYWLYNDRGRNTAYFKKDFDVVTENAELFTSVEQKEKLNTLDKHYNFTYTLSESEKQSGVLKIDPYFVAKQWKLGEKDNSGALWHCFKTIARFGEKNPVEREIKALHLQIKRLAELENVTLD